MRQANEVEAQATSTVLTDVVSAFAAYQTSERSWPCISRAISIGRVAGYHDLHYQNGSGTILDLLDAERTYRATQLAFRQALAAYDRRSANHFVVGRQVMQ